MSGHVFETRHQRTSRLAGFEPLELRRLLHCADITSFGICVPGDSNLDGQFDQLDFVQVLQADKYSTDRAMPTATWSEGDWDGNNTFDQLDLVNVSIAGTYLQGPFVENLSPLMTKVPAHSGPFGPPISITDQQQLSAAISDWAAVDAIAKVVDFNSQQLLMFSWSGSGGDLLIAEPKVVRGQTVVDLQFEYGLTDDIRPHQALLAISKKATWKVNVEDRVVHEDSSRYTFVADVSQLTVTGGFAGVHDEYAIEGTAEFTRNADGSATFSHVDAVLRGRGLSSLDGQSLDSVLDLTTLTGLQTGDSVIVFSGPAPSGYGVVQLQVFVADQSLTVRGGDFPPCCDFFQHEINARAESIV